MEITLEELNLLDADTYQIIDIRTETELSYGKIPGAVAISSEQLLANPPQDKNKRYVICCHKGCYSVKVADELWNEGYDAVSLAGGYVTWLMEQVKAGK